MILGSHTNLVSQKITEIMRFKVLFQADIFPRLRRENISKSLNFQDRNSSNAVKLAVGDFPPPHPLKG